MLLTPSRIGLMDPCLVIRPPAAFDPGNASRGSILGPRGVALGRISLQNTKIAERPDGIRTGRDATGGGGRDFLASTVLTKKRQHNS
ncbi:MAG: hypothetical protein WA715_11970 [Candidatus Acidiferrum sp.]